VRTPWLTTRQLALVAIFSGLWAAVEFSLGTLLVMINMPFRGAVLTAIALLIIIAVRRMVPKKGTALAMGIIVAIIRITLGGPKILTIAPALVIEAALIEAAFLWTPGGVKELTRLKCAVAGVLSITYSFLHTILMVGIFTGLKKQHFEAVVDYFDRMRMGLFSLWAAFVLLIVIHVIFGAGAGLISFRMTKRITARK
jgi:hypothetical protein